MKRHILHVLAIVLAFASFEAYPAYPDKPVRLIVPVDAGGSIDTIARLLASRLEPLLGQAFVVVNRPGGNGNVAFENVARAQPDGYTLLVCSDALAINPSLYKNVRYDPTTSFAPVSLVTTAALALVAHPSLGVTTLEEFIGVARQRGKALTVASPGSGSAGHLAGVLFQSESGLSWTHVAYKGGGPAVADLLGGHVDALFVTVAPTVPHVKAGKLRALAVTSTRASSAMPDVPTVAASGLPGFDVTNWQGVLAPAGTPPEIVEKLAATIRSIVAEPEIQDRLTGLGFEPVAGGPAELGTRIATSYAKWAEVIPSTNALID